MPGEFCKASVTSESSCDPPISRHQRVDSAWLMVSAPEPADDRPGMLLQAVGRSVAGSRVKATNMYLRRGIL